MENEKKLILEYLKTKLSLIENTSDKDRISILSEIVEEIETDSFKDKILEMLDTKYSSEGKLSPEDYQLYKRLKARDRLMTRYVKK